LAFGVWRSGFRVPVTELVEVPGSRFKVPGSKLPVTELACSDPSGSKCKIQDSRFQITNGCPICILNFLSTPKKLFTSKDAFKKADLVILNEVKDLYVAVN
jgi:hypothetical protein